MEKRNEFLQSKIESENAKVNGAASRDKLVANLQETAIGKEFLSLLDKIYTIRIHQDFVFGSYYADTSADKLTLPLTWRVVTITEDKKALLLCNKAIECRKFDIQGKEASWETSKIRNWLNEDFCKVAFSLAEKQIIHRSSVAPHINPKYFRENKGNNTLDEVFLLSLLEVEQFFPNPQNRLCSATVRALSQGAYTSLTGRNCRWWLGTRGDSNGAICYVQSNGEISYNGALANNETITVRPAIWISLC